MNAAHNDPVYNPRPYFYAVAACAWLLGFVFSLMPVAAYEAQSFMLAVLCAGFAVFFVLAVAPVSALKSVFNQPVFLALLGLWALGLISVGFSEAPFVSFIYFCFFSVLPLSAILAAGQGGQGVFFKILGYGLAILFACLALSCLAQYFIFTDMLLRESVHWPLANPNSLAGLLSLALFGAVGWMFAAPVRWQSTAALVLAGLLVFALYTTTSRGAIVAFLIGFALFLFLVRGHLGRHKRCMGTLLGLAVLGFILASVFGSGLKENPLALVIRSFDGSLPLLSSRLLIWESAWGIFTQHIWTGTGIGTFFLYYPEMRSPMEKLTVGLMAHNDPLQFAVEMGVLAPVLFYSMVVLAGVRTVRALKACASDDVKRVFIAAPACALLAMVIHAHITFHFHVLSALMLSGVLFGFWFVQTRAPSVKNPESEPFFEPASVRWALALPLMGLLAVFSAFQASEILINQAQAAALNGQMQEYADKTNRAGRLSFYRNARTAMTATTLPLGIAQLNAVLMPPEEAKALYLQIEALLNMAQAANPRLPQVLYARAELESYMGAVVDGRPSPDFEEIQSYLNRALALDPMYLDARMMLANMLLRQKRREEARDVLDAGLSWYYYNQSPRFFLEKTYNLAQDLGDEALQSRVERQFALYGIKDKIVHNEDTDSAQ